MGIEPAILNLGGGFGVPYSVDDCELNLEPIARELEVLHKRVPSAQLVIELGRYLVAESGWYLTRVVANQTHGRRLAVVVDGGTHQRSNICRLNLPNSTLPIILNAKKPYLSALAPTDVLGCLCLPDDVLGKACPLPQLNVGDVLAFPIAGSYGMSASPTRFLGHTLPAEIAFQGTIMEVLRPRERAHATLGRQKTLGTFIATGFADRGCVQQEEIGSQMQMPEG